MLLYMKVIVISSAIFVAGCGNSKTQKDIRTKDSAATAETTMLPDSIKIANNPPGIIGTDSSQLTEEKRTSGGEENITYGDFKKTPACVREMIEKFSSEEVTNPPRKIYKYNYNGKIVFYVPALCCDFFSDLYDMDCKLIGHPDGGYTGKGDGSFSDFNKVKKNEKLIWEDSRKR